MLIKNKGFTLTELLVAIAINAILFSSLIAMIVTNLNHYHKAMDVNRLNLQLESAIQLMANDIRRAGYWANAQNDAGLDQNNNPFMAVSTDISTGSGGSCILFTYDHANNGTLPAIAAGSDDDRYGFQLSNSAIQARVPGASFSCGASGWENITDTKIIQITALSFTLTTKTVVQSGTKAIAMRSVDITVTGRLASDNTITKTLTQHVRIRNDKFIP